MLRSKRTFVHVTARIKLKRIVFFFYKFTLFMCLINTVYNIRKYISGNGFFFFIV